MRRLIQICVLMVFSVALGGPGPTAAESPAPARSAAPAQERLVVLESFMLPGDSNSMAVGPLLDQLASEYAGQPVVFLEQNRNSDLGERLKKYWWTGYYATGGGLPALPFTMVDSGTQVADGYSSDTTFNTYKAMVDAALGRPSLVEIQFESQRVGNKVQFDIQLTSRSDRNLGPANGALVHAIVYEKHTPLDPNTDHVTERIVRAVVSANIDPVLLKDQTRTFALESGELSSVVNWARVRTLVLADYRPGGWTGVYDVLHAVRADDEPSLTVSKLATPDPVLPGAPLTYTISIINTGDLALHATVTDTLPEHVTYTGDLVWTPTIATPDGVWEHTFAVTVEQGYTGTLVNRVQVVSEEGATGESFAVTNGRKIYLPLVMRQ
jgi:uncharacterized repeat protein (TIGR01451 family)